MYVALSKQCVKLALSLLINNCDKSDQLPNSKLLKKKKKIPILPLALLGTICKTKHMKAYCGIWVSICSCKLSAVRETKKICYFNTSCPHPTITIIILIWNLAKHRFCFSSCCLVFYFGNTLDYKTNLSPLNYIKHF